MKRFIGAWRVAAYAFALWAAASAVYALTAGTNISLQNGSVSVTGPPSATSLTANGIVLGGGSSAVTATAACTTANQVLLSGSPPACGALTDAHVPDNISIDLADEATALAANGGNCSAGQYPLGVDASGAAEGCTAIPFAPMWAGTMMELTTSQTVFIGAGVVDATENKVAAPMPAATYRNLRCRQNAAAGGSNNVAITMRVGTCGSESDSSLVCTITGGASAATCADTSNTAATTAGQCMSLKVVTPAALTNSQVISCSWERSA